MKTNKKKTEGRNVKNKTLFIVPTIILFTLIITILSISIVLINDKEIDISKMFSNSIMADTENIGDSINATFNSETGEITISGSGTINKESFRAFIDSCGAENIQTITFENEVLAPSDSSELFKDLNALTTINNLNNLNTSNVVNMSSMFENTGLTAINFSNWDTSNVTNINSIFANCLSLMELYTPAVYSTETVNLPTDKWYNVSDTEDNNIYSNYNDTTFTAGSVHLKKLVDYSIDYILDPDIEIENPTSYNALSSFTLNNPEKTGYKFIGWTSGDEETKQEKVSILPRTLTGNLTYTANWQQVYTIAYDLDGGKLKEGITNPTEYAEEDGEITLNKPTKEGYRFTGWTGSNGETPEIEVIIDPTIITENLTYTANWQQVYTIAYDLDGGKLEEGITNPTEYAEEDGEITLNKPAKEGYRFTGWTGSNGETPEIEVIIDPTIITENLTYTANWQQVYTIAYDLDGGKLEEGITNPTEYAEEDGEITLNKPAKEGYRFTGWTGSNGETPEIEVIIDPTIITENLTYTANWQQVYTIAYDLDGGKLKEGITNPTEYAEEDGEITLNKPTKEGYRFTGWTGSNGETPEIEVIIDPTIITENLTYTANWQQVYTIAYDLDGGKLEEGITNPTEYAEEDGEITLNKPAKEGYRFTGWTGSNGETPEIEVIIDPTIITENLTYTANWQQVYTIAYDLDGGKLKEGITNPTEYAEEDGEITLNKPTKEGYRFTGWTGSNGETPEIEVIIDPTIITENLTYTANWQQVYTIAYDLDGGKLEEGITNPTEYAEEDGEITLNKPAKEGYRFTGWTGSNGETPEIEVIIDPTIITENLTYTANWQQVYTIAYDLDGGKLKEGITNPTEYAEEDGEITLNKPIKEGYRFIGWTGSNGETPEIEVIIDPTIITENLTYTANWQQVYTIAYDLDGGKLKEGITNPTEYAEEDGEITLNKPTKEGYRFTGWTGSNGETPEIEVIIDPTIITENLTYTANWQQVYTIAYDLDGGKLKEGITNPTEYAEEDGEITLNKPTKEGYRFTGWTGSNGETPEIEVIIDPTIITENLTYTANWQQVYTIAYDLDGGKLKEGITNPTEYAEEDGEITLNKPAKEGYRFTGWTGSNGETPEIEVIIDPTIITENLTYTANWQQVYTIAYDLDGGKLEEGITNPTEYAEEDGEITLNKPTKEGYRFTGWTGSNGETPEIEVIIDPTIITENLTYTANWQQVYTIAYDLDGGKLEEGITNPTEYAEEDGEITLNKPAKEGYRFTGWTGSNGETPEIEVIIDPTIITENLTYTANWQQVYTIAYDLDGGKLEEGITNPTEYAEEDGEITLNKPAKEGYRFTGWTGSNGETPEIEVIIDPTIITENLTYTANWQQVYTIAYDLDGGKLKEGITNPTEYAEEDGEITLNKPTKEGYRFTGWTGSNGETPEIEVIIDPTIITENLTYTANWQQVYTIAYDLDGGKLEEGITNPTEYAEEDGEITLNKPAKEGYRFTGWTGSNGETPEIEVIIDPTIITENLTYTANWQQVYTIAYDLDGGKLKEGITNPTEYAEEDGEITLNKPTKEGYRFTGWTGSNGETPEIEVIIDPTIITENLTYTANWQQVYTIAYDLDGGKLEEGITNPTEYAEEDGEITLNKPAKEGYRFTGWTGSNGETPEIEVIIDPTIITENLTYTANWQQVYTIAYDLDGGKLKEGITNPTEYAEEDGEITLNKPIKEGYRFIGWTGSNGETPEIEVIIDPTIITENLTYTANWQQVYTIAYDLDGGKLKEGITNPTEYAEEDGEITLNKPTKEGYRFTGWTGSNGETPEIEVIIDPTIITENLTYTANWQQVYTIAYDLDGGKLKEGITNPTEYAEEDGEITLNKPTKEGYRFTGWTGSNGETPEIEVIIDPTIITENLTYTANWQQVYTIAYDLDGGKLKEGITNPTEYAEEDGEITLNKPAKEGYRFTGWTGSNGETPEIEVIIDPTIITENLTYTANWQQVYTIAYDLDGGKLEEGITNPTEYAEEDGEITLNKPTKEGYRFTGWTGTDIEGSEPKKEVTIPVGATGNREYTAHWEAENEEYIITYYLDGGTEPNPANETRYTGDKAITLREPTKEGYEFIGWTGTDIEGSEPKKEVTIPIGATGNREYTANWIKIYTITYDLDGGELEEGITNPTEFTEEDGEITLNKPTKEGYRFIGWTGSNGETPEKEVRIDPATVTEDLTYTANWQQVYTIAYDLDGGKLEEGITNPTEYAEEDGEITLNKPTKEGYIFIGWTGTDIEGSEPKKEVTIPVGATGNREYTAHWEAENEEYIITYYLDGGTEPNPANETRYTGDKAITLREPTKEGYIFTGWTGTDIEGIEPKKEVTIPIGATGNREYTAHWTEIYTITYDLDGGKLEDGTTNPTEFTVEDGEITLNKPTKEGYRFIGWTGSNGETPEKEVRIDPATVTEDLTYTANWQQVYTIAYDLDGGKLEEGITNPTEYAEEDGEITLNKPTKEGYEFLGWTGSNGETPEIEVTIDPTEVTENLTYTANWQQVYTIAYDLDGGKLEDGTTNPTEFTVEDGEITLNKPTKEGYRFIGWTGSNGETPEIEVTIDPTEVTENLTYTANWQQVYTIAYDLDGGKLEEGITNPTEYAEEDGEITLNKPTKEGYRFIGWTGTDIEGSEPKKEVTIPVGATGNREYTAHWEAENEEYIITYDLDGGTEPNPANETRYTGDKAITLREPTKEGYIFTGWTGTDIEGSEPKKEVTIPIGATGNREYTANWQIRTDLTYTVNYLEKGTNKVLNEAKTETNQTFGDVIISNNEIIEILGYRYESVDKQTLTISTGENIINIYYTIKTSQVIVHHYIYNQEAETEDGKYTTTKLVEDEITQGREGQEYSTNKSTRVPLNYTCVNERPDKHSGTMTEDDIEVKYYYSLTRPTVVNNITLGANIPENKQNTELKLTKEDGVVTYNINYTTTISNYIGKAKIEIVDELPSNIDINKSDLAGGHYDEQRHTITWTEQISNINTFANGNYTKDITKQIRIVYKGQDVTQDLVNRVTGKTKTYYPEVHLNKGGEIIVENSANASNQIKQEYKVDFKVTAVWEDNNNLKNRRPESVTVQIKVLPNNETLTKELNEENNWTYEEKGLIKYNSGGQKITYEITQTEKNEGDLEYYESPDVKQTETQVGDVTNYTTTITNAYRLINADLNTEITIEGKEEIQTEEELEYTINVKSKIEDYIGEGKITIEAKVPYEIDLEKSEIEEGIYNKELKTISWEIELPHINTNSKEVINRAIAEGEYDQDGVYVIDITKKIKLSYKDIDLEQEKIETEVKAKIELYETEEKDEKVESFSTNINVPGKLIVKYVEKATGKEIAEKEEILDKIGKEYSIESKEIAGYRYIESTNNETGRIKEEDQEIIFYYEVAPIAITVKYQDKEGNELLKDIVIEGNIGENYKTEQKEIENYKYVEVKGNPEGTITQDETIIYVYEKVLNVKLNVKYIDINTQQDITYKEGEEDKIYSYEISGNSGDEYETEEKDIPYYILVESPENKKGKLEKEENTVIYSYRKLNFDFSIEETIGGIQLNGENIEITDDKLAKVEIPTGKIASTNLIVKYNIKIKNQGELDGTAKILKTIPQEYEIAYLPEEWKENKDGELETEVQLEAGESKTLSVALKWKNTEENLGSQTSTVRIEETKNSANFEDTNKEDNKSQVIVIVSVKTGETVSIIIIAMLIVVFIITGYITYRIINKKQSKINNIKFLK